MYCLLIPYKQSNININYNLIIKGYTFNWLFLSTTIWTSSWIRFNCLPSNETCHLSSSKS